MLNFYFDVNKILFAPSQGPVAAWLYSTFVSDHFKPITYRCNGKRVIKIYTYEAVHGYDICCIIK
jgi:hypothetical protein